MAQYDWLNKKFQRSVDSLRLWSENPRLNPDNNYLKISDYIKELFSDKSEKDSFIQLITSIAEKGFIPADPIVVWKNTEDGHFYVAEGNRRVLALKLLITPKKAPKCIRSLIQEYSSKVSLNDILKIPVCIAPSLDDSVWYINERHNSHALQKPWSRLQQQRWIAKMYRDYHGDVERILAIAPGDKKMIESDIRILKLIDLIRLPEVKRHLTEANYVKIISHKFPISILERFFNYAPVRERWNIVFDGTKVIIKSEKDSFCEAYAELLTRIVTGEGDIKINTRMTVGQAPEILDSLPMVIASDSDMMMEENKQLESQKSDFIYNSLNESVADSPKTSPIQKNDKNRNKLILPIYQLKSEDAKLTDLFEELKKLSVSKYPTCICASLRIFLDISIRLYITAEGWKEEVARKFKCDFKETTLKQRLTFVKDKFKPSKEQQIITRLLNPQNPYSLDVLNCYVHSSETHYELKQFMNGFWDFLFPLFQKILSIEEVASSDGEI